MTTGREIARSVRVAYMAMHRQTQSLLSTFGITAEQYVLLALLDIKDAITQQELTRRASSDPNTIRDMLVRMERHGLVSRQPHDTDRRAWSVRLTAKGQQTYAKLSKGLKPLQDTLLSPFAAQEAKTVVDFFNRIADAMKQWEQDHQKTLKNVI